MTKLRFISMVRQYAALARRKRRSYGAQVEALLQMRLDAVDASGVSSAVYEAERIWSVDFVNREYSASDPQYQPRLPM